MPNLEKEYMESLRKLCGKGCMRLFAMESDVIKLTTIELEWHDGIFPTHHCKSFRSFPNLLQWSY